MPDMDVTAALDAAIGPGRMQVDPIPEPEQLIAGLAEHGYAIVPAGDAEELAELRALFELQHRRMAEATERWRAEDPDARALTLPDVGALLTWLMRDADRVRAGVYWDQNLTHTVAGIPAADAVAQLLRQRYIENGLANPEAWRQAEQATRDHADAWLRGDLVHPGEDVDEMDRRLIDISRWVDESPANAARDPEARTWGRLAKVAEEAGEVVAAYVGATGQNPRKGVSDTMDHVAEELLDVALTALAAYAHVRPGHSPMRALEAHLVGRMHRAGLS